MGKSRCGVPGCETLTNSCDNLFRLPESEEVLKELGFPDQFENLEDFRVCSQHFTADSFQLSDSGKKKLSTNPKVKTNVKFDHSESFDEQEIDLAAWAIPVCQLKVESIDKSSSKLKEFCQFCLKEQKDDCFKKLLDDELQESFFDLTRKKLDVLKFSEFICCLPCLTKFEETIQYRNDLLNNQRVLEAWFNSSLPEIFHEDDKLAITNFAIKTENDADFNVEFMNLACPFQSSSFIESINDSLVDQQLKFEHSEAKRESVELMSNSPRKKSLEKKLEDATFACTECNKSFLKKVYLRKHFNNVHKQGLDEVCQHCGKLFKNSKRLKAHLLTHQSEKKYKCNQCPKQFVSSGDLSRHLRVHSQEKPFLCHVCSKSFRRSDALNLHMDTHNREGFTCDMCASKFTNRRSLKEHILKCINNRNRQYRAPRLPRPSRNSIYKDDPVYKCFVVECDRQFTIRNSLGIHLDKIHNLKFDKFETTCLECQLVFETAGEHASHVKIHSCKFVCDMCKVRFKTDDKLQAHITRIHQEGEERPFICAEVNCGARFKRAAHLQSHRNYKHSDERKFECNLCGVKCHERGSLNVHMRSHSNIKPFPCWSCEYEGKTSSKLKQHMTLVHNENRIYCCKFQTCSQKFEFHTDLTQHEKGH